MTDFWVFGDRLAAPREAFVKRLRQQWTNPLTSIEPLARTAALNQRFGKKIQIGVVHASILSVCNT
jgi:hypothetical protein